MAHVETVPIKDKPTIANVEAVLIKDQRKIANIEALPMKDKPKTTNLEAVLMKDQTKMVNIEAVPIKDRAKMANLEAVPIRDKPKSTNLEAVLIKDQTKMVNIEAVPNKDEAKVANAETVPIKDQTKTAKVEALPMKVQPKMLNVEAVQSREKFSSANRHGKIEKNSLWNNLPRPNIQGWSTSYRLQKRPKIESWTERRVKINVGGSRFQTMESTLRKYPETLLGCNEKDKYFDKKLGEYFFDRDPGFFRHILNFYRKGKVHFSQFQCGLPYDEELMFYRIDPDYIGTCCREEYDSMYVPCEATMKENEKLKENLTTPDIELCETFREKIYTIFKYPQVNLFGKFAFYLVASAIIVSVITTVIETISCGAIKCGEKYSIVFKFVDGVCVVIFVLEFSFRFYAAKKRLKHLRSLNTVIDALAILPFFVNLTVNAISSSTSTEMQALVVLRVFRIFRVFKLMRISERLQFLGKSLRASAPDLMFLCFTILIGVLIFSTIIFFAEQAGEKSNFNTIPAAMWFGAQTMTTLGYGDITPSTAIGKLVAAVFCLGGILVIALPVPIIEMKQKITAQYEHSLKSRRSRGRKEQQPEKRIVDELKDKLECCQQTTV